jgi:uncharacterized protein
MAPHSLSSALYVGETVHFRRKPALNRFVYSLFMAFVDLDELESGALDYWPVFSSKSARSLTSLLARDHLVAGNASSGNLSRNMPLSTRVRAVVQAHTGRRPEGPILLLAGLRVFGLEFNPVSFYYVFNREETAIEVLVAEVNNIPWFEQHVYVLLPHMPPDPPSVDGKVGNVTGEMKQHAKSDLIQFSSHKKAFHVSPFMPIEDIEYHWQVGLPAHRLRLRIGLKQDKEDVFMASLNMHRRPFSVYQIVWLVLTYPFMTIKVVLGIMYEAAKLWMHGSFTFYSHPEGAETASSKFIANCVSTSIYIRNLVSARRAEA